MFGLENKGSYCETEWFSITKATNYVTKCLLQIVNFIRKYLSILEL